MQLTPKSFILTKLDLSNLIKYAKNKGVRVCDLTEEEKSRFMHK